MGMSIVECVPEYLDAHPSINEAGLLSIVDGYNASFMPPRSNTASQALSLWMRASRDSSLNAPFGNRIPSTTMMASLISREMTPVVFWEWDTYAYARWNQWPTGVHDSYLDQIIADVNTWRTYASSHSIANPKIIVRLNQEMNWNIQNGGWAPWATGSHAANGGNPAYNILATDVITGWRYVYDYLVTTGGCGDILKFFYCPWAFTKTGSTSPNDSIVSCWPGDSTGKYVDYMGADAYCDNSQASHEYTLWSLVSDAFYRLNQDCAGGNGKPIIVGETAISRDANTWSETDRANWIDGTGFAAVASGIEPATFGGGFSGLKNCASQNPPNNKTWNVRGAMYFNINMHTIGKAPDWHVEPWTSGIIQYWEGAALTNAFGLNTGRF
jgi:hypothetical protein